MLSTELALGIDNSRSLNLCGLRSTVVGKMIISIGFISLARLTFRGVKIMSFLLYVKHTNQTVPSMFRKMVAKHPDRTMLVQAGDGKEWTYRQVKTFYSTG